MICDVPAHYIPMKFSALMRDRFPPRVSVPDKTGIARHPVSDSPADIQAAKNAKVPSVAIARGPIQAERLSREGPDRMFADLDEMTSFLLGRV